MTHKIFLQKSLSKETFQFQYHHCRRLAVCFWRHHKTQVGPVGRVRRISILLVIHGSDRVGSEIWRVVSGHRNGAVTSLQPETALLPWPNLTFLINQCKAASRGAGAPPFPRFSPCPFTSSFALFYFSIFSLALTIFLFCPSLPFLAPCGSGASK